jgi:hypothetical protein
MTPSELDWLTAVHTECRNIILRISTHQYDQLFGNLRKLFDEKIETTEPSWEIKNLIASLAMTDPEVLRGRITLQNAAIERLTQVRSRIKDAIAHANTGSIV